MKIVFLGTADFAVPSLDILVQNGYDVVGVITAPDKPAGRGLKLTESPVKKYAKEKGLHVLQPIKLKDPEFIEKLKSLNADLQVVVAFRMLPEVVWKMPPLGTMNLHASLLPQYRGAAPINWAIINGEKETGVTTFFLKHEIDTGNIIFQEKVEIGEDETAGDLHDKLMGVGARLILKTVKAIGSVNYTLIEQKAEGELKHAPKIFKEDCKIDWSLPIDAIYNFIRGLSPYPGAWTELDAKTLKIYRASKEYIDHSEETGHLVTDNKNFIKVAVKGGFINLEAIQLEGKKKMMVTAFLNGYQFERSVTV